LENLSESSWYTKQNARWCAAALRNLFIGSGLTALIVLLVVASSARTGATSNDVARCVASTLAFLVSVGVLKSWLAFERYARECARIDEEAERLLNAAPVTALDAHRLLSEYQLIRASAPAIPTIVWSKRRDKLNDTWNDLKRPISRES
jgi:hypothetical protein